MWSTSGTPQYRDGAIADGDDSQSRRVQGPRHLIGSLYVLPVLISGIYLGHHIQLCQGGALDIIINHHHHHHPRNDHPHLSPGGPRTQPLVQMVFLQALRGSASPGSQEGPELRPLLDQLPLLGSWRRAGRLFKHPAGRKNQSWILPYVARAGDTEGPVH